MRQRVSVIMLGVLAASLTALADEKPALATTDKSGATTYVAITNAKKAVIGTPDFPLFTVLNRAGNVVADNSVRIAYEASHNFTAIAAPAAGKEVKTVEYYDLSGKRLAAPARGITIKRVTYTDGSSFEVRKITK